MNFVVAASRPRSYSAICRARVKSVGMANRDLFWHTFTIEKLGVDLLVPVGANRSVTFEASPGQYRFLCRIPGHTDAGMDGTLIITG